MDIFQWNFIQNSKLVIQRNALENAVCEMAAILSVPQSVESTHTQPSWICYVISVNKK